MAEPTPPRPRPIPTSATLPFWEAARRRELVLQRCSGCGAFRHYPQPMCPACRSLAFAWERASGRGTIHSYTVSHRAFHAFWKERTPYVIATIELEEGVRMVCDMPGLAPERAAIGLAVEVCFEEVDAELTLPRWRVVSSR